ncbi:ParA family protein [Priestia megaterium]|uniref:ParA family protein n=1 Tax=Priestia megaterium TaxID=1404 RepID=UPI0023DA3314|nr:AAA family ATPase [Priestia megaterium]MDF2010232.1 AAA family ATPase [Priestia megaterium]
MIISISNNKGGVLKTTTTTNLAGVLASYGNKVLIVDADSQSNVPLCFGANPDDYRINLYDILTSNVPVEEAIYKVHKNIDIIPSNDSLKDIQVDEAKTKTRPELVSLFKNKIYHLKERYDYILIDTPPNLDSLTGNAFVISDYVVIPHQPELFSMRSLGKVIDNILECKEYMNPKLEIIGVLITLIDGRTKVHNEFIQETNKDLDGYDLTIFDTFVPKTIEFENSFAYKRVPLTLSKRSSEYKHVYYDVWKEIEERIDKKVKVGN